jgi:aspartate aminotransferase-like enzyme
MMRSIGLGRRMTHGEVFRAGNIGAQPSADYQRALFVLDNVVRECITVSRNMPRR